MNTLKDEIKRRKKIIRKETEKALKGCKYFEQKAEEETFKPYIGDLKYGKENILRKKEKS